MKLEDIFSQYGSKPLIKPYVIAEAGVNHEGSMDLAKRLINEAKEGGAHAIKFQTYKAKYLASKNSPSYWDLSQESTTSQFELFSKYDKFWKKEYEELKVECDNVGIEFMSTPFDVASADFLNDLMPAIKISSSDLTNTPFIEHLCGYKKPILLSTGASDMWEIERAVDSIRKMGNPLSILHCILNYPTPNENANLGMILNLKSAYPDLVLGYSDHTLPEEMETLLQAHLLGAVVLEKHFTFDKTLPGNDHYHSMDMNDLKLFTSKINDLYVKLGSFKKYALEAESGAVQNARRSLVIDKLIAKGEILTKEHLTWKRPASGISPADIEKVIGKRVNMDLSEDTILKHKMIDYDS